MKKGALASGGLALGVTGIGSAAAQDGDGVNYDAEYKALMYNWDFRPRARFRVVSDVLRYNPREEGVTEGSYWSEYNTRLIKYENTNEQVLFFPAHDAEVQKGQLYSLGREFSLFADDVDDSGVMSASFSPVREDDQGDTGTATPGTETTDG